MIDDWLSDRDDEIHSDLIEIKIKILYNTSIK